MPKASDTSHLFVLHPDTSTKETCRACLAVLQAKKDAIEADETLKPSQKRSELAKKEGIIRRGYWKISHKTERSRHLANCPYQSQKIRQAARDRRNGKSGSPDTATDDSGPMAHFKEARARPPVKPPSLRQTRTSARQSSSSTVSYVDSVDDSAFEEMIATGEHARYLQNLKDEAARMERKKQAELAARLKPKEDEYDNGGDVDYTDFFGDDKSRSPSPA